MKIGWFFTVVCIFFNSLVKEAHVKKTLLHKQPVKYLGLQVKLFSTILTVTHGVFFCVCQIQNFPKDFEKLESHHFEFFLNRNTPILGMDAKPHPNPKVKANMNCFHLS